jgi:hypothetical protein
MKNSFFTLEKALEVCKKRNLYSEMVFLLGRMGSTKDALDLLIMKIKDVKQAIDFVEEHNDDTLWKDLVKKSLRNADFVGGLLDHIGGGAKVVDPRELIQQIPETLNIANLKQRLIRIVTDYGLESRLREGALSIMNTDCVALLYRANSELKQASSIDPQDSCDVCKSSLGSYFAPTSRNNARSSMSYLSDQGLSNKKFSESEVIIFKCGHKFHNSCSQNSNGQYMRCAVCSNESNISKSKK